MTTIKSFNIICTCPFCGHETPLTVDFDDFTAYLNGALVQDAFPYLPADERELIMTGICSKCWDDTFREEGEENSPEWHDTCDDEEQADFWANDWLIVDDSIECGFDPYLGCYTDDC